MELEELKASWNALDKRLAETEIVNMRMVKEMIQQKTKSAYDHIVGHNVYNLVVCILIICGVFPYVYMNTPIRTLSFVMVEGVMVIGLIPQVWKLSLLSKFDWGSKLLHLGTWLQQRGWLRTGHTSSATSGTLSAYLRLRLCLSPLAASPPCHADAGDRTRTGRIKGI